MSNNPRVQSASVSGNRSGTSCEPIAIVGMGCRFPGAPDVDRYWQVIRDGVDATGEIPPTRWDAGQFFDPTGEIPGKMTTRWGGFLDDVDQFDALFFRISPREAEKIDPQQRLLLEVTWEALEYGGLAPLSLRGTATGVFVGIGGVDYSRIPVQLEEYFEQVSVHTGTGNALSIAANRISYTLDLRGPSMIIDTACSSSLVAVHLAAQSLRSGECDQAIAGGVNLILTPETTIAFSKARMLSPDGVCRPFDAAANGYVRGEGCGILVLKRLGDAAAARDNVLAVIRGSAVNHDGLTSGITAPRGPSQRAVIRQVLDQAGLTPNCVGYIEAHGTGTPLGDPIEVRALADLFPQCGSEVAPCYLGSVKANIGHTETSAGVAGLIKIILMMRHRCIPGQTHFQQLNPHIQLEGTRLRIPLESIPWESETPRIAGVSSFGFGGTNAHVALEEPSTPELATPGYDRTLHVLTLSAKTAAGVGKVGQRYADYLREHPGLVLPDLCHTANTGRSHFEHRATVTAETTEQLQRRLADLAKERPGRGVRRGATHARPRQKVAFLFAGQGTQYVGMGRRLMETQPVFRNALTQCDEWLRGLLDHPLMSVLFDESAEEAWLDRTAYTQPALFALEYALATLWQSWGIEPKLVLGHSVGEYVAACVAGVFSLKDGLRLIAGRARLMQQLPERGAMAAILATSRRVSETIAPWADQVAVAATNAPELTVISGAADCVERLVAQFRSAGIGTQKLNVSHAFHSPQMEPILDELERLAGEVAHHAPRIPLISNLTGELMGDAAPGPAYWRHHARHTVRFAEGVRCLAAHELDAVVEIGPSTTLLGMAKRCGIPSEAAWLPSLRPGRDDLEVILESLSELYVRGAAVDWEAFDAPWPRRRTVLPTYPFERRRYWYDLSRRTDVSAHRSPLGPPIHPLLGSPIPSAGTQTLFQVTLDSATPPYLREHCVEGSAVLPAAAYIEQALAAAHHVFGPENHVVENLSLPRAMTLAPGRRRTVQVVLSRESNGRWALQTHSRHADAKTNGQDWVLHACGTLRAGDRRRRDGAFPTIDRPALMDRVAEKTDRARFYQIMADAGIQYGAAFQVLDDLQCSDGEAVATVRIAPEVLRQSANYHVHPAVLDACFQSMAGVVESATGQGDRRQLYLPTFVRRIQLHATPSEQMWTYAVRTSHSATADRESAEGDVYLVQASGQLVAELKGLRVQRVGRVGPEEKPRDWREWLYTIQWQTQPHTETQAQNGRESEAAGGWLVFADRQGIADALVGQLESRGEAPALVRPGSRFRTVADRSPREPVTIYEIHPLSSEHYRQMLEDWKRNCSAVRGVIYLWGVDIPSVDQNGRDLLGRGGSLQCGCVLQLLKQFMQLPWAKSLGTYVITRGAQPVLTDGPKVALSQTALWGLGRTAALELPQSPCRLVDLDPCPDVESAASCLANEVMEPSRETQVAFRSGVRYVARLTRAPDVLPREGRISKSTVPPRGPFALRLGSPGNFDSLYYAPLPRRVPGPDQVELKVGAVGLNFSDILKAMGVYPGMHDEVVPLGIECAGVVTAIGETVDRFQIGQRVLGVAPYSLASHAVTAEYALVPTPDHLSDEEACTLPITLLTAYYALHHLAHLQRGERVLIHAGAGGVGQAAIQIAQHVGAEIFATAGSDEKREFLRGRGIPHVLNSRTLEFADQILEITDGQGVDVVLNSLPGDAIPKSISILSGYGRFLEIGKTDIYLNRMIGLSPFQDNLSFFAIDLDRMLRQRPDTIRTLFAELMEHVEKGHYRPLPFTSFRDRQVVPAFRYMAQRRNIGKVVVTYDSAAPKHGNTSDTESDRAAVAGGFRADGTYLVTGGLGALGMWITEWLARGGAKHVALLSRSAPRPEVELRLHRLRASGLEIVILESDVTDEASLSGALDRIPTTFPALRGVFHAAGVLADGMMFEMELAQLDRAMAPKVQGAWNLHQATLGDALDFFVLFSSSASVLGSPGQANYAAGNAFLDGLAHHRRSLGLPATSINWGPWAEAGMAGDGEQQRQLARKGMNPLPPDTALDVLGSAVRGNAANVAVMDVRWHDLLARIQGPGPPLLDNVATDAAAAGRGEASTEVDEALCRKLRAATAPERERLLSDCIADAVASVMGVDREILDAEQPLSSLGMDSLLGMELKTKLESRLGVDLPMASLFDGPTITSLARLTGDLLVPQREPTPRQSEADGQPAAADGTRGEREAWSPLVRLAKGGPHVPLFCVHPVGGDLRCYMDLARRLQDDRPVWGLRPPGLVAQSQIHRSMDDLATEYIQAIRQAQPIGPYHLAGWSTGGIFAYEMAHRLHTEHASAASLVLLDTPMPSIFRGVDLQDNPRFLFDLVNFSNWFAGTQMQVSHEQLRERGFSEALELVHQEAIRHHVLPTDSSVEHLRRLVEVCKHHVQIILEYEPRPWDEPVDMLRPIDATTLAEAAGQDLDDDLGWRRVLHRLTVHRVPGNHFSMMTGARVGDVAATLRKCLEVTHSPSDIGGK